MFEELRWERVPVGSIRSILAAALKIEEAALKEVLGKAAEGEAAALPFYKHFRLLRLNNVGATEGTIYALWSKEVQDIFVLDGNSEPIHDVNGREHLKLTDKTVEAYFRFFMFAVRGPEGPFVLYEKPTKGGSKAVARLARPLERVPPDVEKERGVIRFKGVVAYANGLFQARFAVDGSGGVVMTDDEREDVELAPGDMPEAPSLADGARLTAWLQSGSAGEATSSSTEPSALFILVELLLEKALSTLPRNRLIENFNASIAKSSALSQFAALVRTELPVVVIESSMAFVEETVADILDARMAPETPMRRHRASFRPEDITQIEFVLPDRGPGIVLAPLQVYKTVWDVDRFAYQLATGSFAALIASEKFDRLPESLRQLKDVTLQLPNVDAAIFATLFRRVTGHALPAGWNASSESWVRYVLHTDFGHPRRMHLSADKALDYIKTEVLDRLATVQSDEHIGLKDLNGLGEAKRFAEDLIADIHSAVRGDIPWAYVDRGALLVGAPGTGKTTLAKAIAKDCGVRFVSASPAEWQSAGYLNNHINAIRRSFAEARNFAPAILFIDEIDSIGSRESFGGANSQYHTEVVNAVLEQIQGIDPAAPVFIIGATNFEDRVDPALKRAGRLDRVIRIPRPNSAALGLIYDYYLREIASGSGLDPSVDTKVLGGLSLGLTGADVEKIVRGSVRRARMDKRSLGQNDLVAELTNKPRDGEDYPRMSPEEIEATAVHESGHALAMYLGAFKGADIGFVTVVPRADGSLGFVAFLPDERQSLTRGDYMEKLEINLAGRAAEEIKFGPDGISGGASSDLQAAMSLAILMVTRYGLGGGAHLTWSAEPSPAHTRQAEKIVTEAYGRIRLRLKENEAKLLRLAGELAKRQELFGLDVRAILAA